MACDHEDVGVWKGVLNFWKQFYSGLVWQSDVECHERKTAYSSKHVQASAAQPASTQSYPASLSRRTRIHDVRVVVHNQYECCKVAVMGLSDNIRRVIFRLRSM